MHGNVVQQQVAEIADALYRRTDELAPVLAHAITREVRGYQKTRPVPFEIVVRGCAGNMLPLTSVMEAYRVGFRCVWDAVMTESATHQRVNGDAMRVLTAKVSTA